MDRITKRPLTLSIVLGLIINIVIELFGRENPLTLLRHITHEPVFFLFGWAFITLTLCLCMFVKRKVFLLTIVSVLWLSMALLNAYVLSYRVTPLCAIDFFIIQISWNFIGVYISVFGLILIILAALVVVFLLVLVYRKSPVTPRKLKSAILKTAVVGALTATLFIVPGILEMSEKHLSDMKSAYDEYGFVYCFFRTSVERGIEEPESYSTKTVVDEVEVLVEEGDKSPALRPNVIMLQLESFFDVNALTDVSFSENPLPFFTKLKQEFSHGRLFTPTVGAGTANTEFELITQMNLDFFGTGEYPYKTVLKDETCETAPFDFMELGYNTFAVHNNNATFYDRNEIFPRLGFETFLSSEYMNDTIMSPGGWIKDVCLISEIEKCLRSTKEQDYVYAISVQGHGAYPTEKQVNPAIRITDSPMEEPLRNQTEYYVNQIHEMDLFLKLLTEKLQTIGEPTVLVLYGDHMPSLEIEPEDLVFGNLFETEYVLWANYAMPQQILDLETYQLSSYVMERLKMNNGVLTKLHQQQRASAREDYPERLRILQYDMLYGEKVTTDEGELYRPTTIKMGVDKIAITRTELLNDKLMVLGTNFTHQSYVAVNGNRKNTALINSRNLTAETGTLTPGDIVTVEQLSDDGVLLSTTKNYVYTTNQ